MATADLRKIKPVARKASYRFFCARAICLGILIANIGQAYSETLAPLWQIQSDQNTVYLLGSVHLLSDGDYPLPASFQAAFDDSDALLMEIDLDDLSVLEVAASLAEKSRIKGDSTLQATLGAQRWLEANQIAKQIGLDLADYQKVKPWYAAMLITQHAMRDARFEPRLGVDQFFATQAIRADKPIDGLETFDEQIDFFDSLSTELQIQLLVQTLNDVDEYADDMQLLVERWRSGDVAFLAEELLAGFKGYPELNDILISKRNAAWLDRVVALTRSNQDYLVVVGALHLVGPDGLNARLTELGLAPKQLSANWQPKH